MVVPSPVSAVSSLSVPILAQVFKREKITQVLKKRVLKYF